jgi:endonuclease/exonuclease/phosphatase family metal-dependent hydrolase
VVKILSDRGVVSAYHSFFSEDDGAETRPTYYFWHRQERPFHLDYVFLPHSWIERVTNVEVGSFAQWKVASDHMPVLVDVADSVSDAA